MLSELMPASSRMSLVLKAIDRVVGCVRDVAVDRYEADRLQEVAATLFTKALFRNTNVLFTNTVFVNKGFVFLNEGRVKVNGRQCYLKQSICDICIVFPAQ